MWPIFRGGVLSNLHLPLASVFLTMILSAVSVIYINTEASIENGEKALSNAYSVLSTDEEDTNSTKLMNSIVNGLVMVTVIGCMTFVIVLLYKYRCMMILTGYMMFAFTSLLGFMSSYMCQVAIERYRIGIDRISYALLIYNFAIVGTTSLFWGKGFPPYIAQGYLIAAAIIVAWQLSHFDAWTAWVLLVLLALYDLFAVLTPCGPLKALVNLMQRDDAPDLPGLLYEARLDPGSNTAAESQRRTSSTPPGGSTTTGESPRERTEEQAAESPNSARQHTGRIPVPNQAEDPEEPTEPESQVQRLLPQQSSDPTQQAGGSVASRPRSGSVPLALALANNLSIPNPPSVDTDVASFSPDELTEEVQVTFREEGCYVLRHENSDDQPARFAVYDSNNQLMRVNFVTPEGTIEEDTRYRPRRTGMVPLAIARLNRLAFANDPQPSWIRRRQQQQQGETSTVNEEDEHWSNDELRREIEVLFPRSGWTITRHRVQKQGVETRYAVVQPDGTLKRILFVNNEGRVFEDLGMLEEINGSGGKAERTTIRLGLGDFIFYSILVSKASVYSFASFCACSVTILIGLMSTLAILALRGHALPALPISIFLGVTFYLLTRFVLQPWIQEVFIQQSYV